MLCPRCSSELENARFEEATIALCPGCEGSWYRAAELTRILEADPDRVAASDLAPTLVEDKLDGIDVEKHFDCPECGEPMVRYQYQVDSDVVIDECPDHGIWLDDGELGRMFEFLQSEEQVGRKRPIRGRLLTALGRFFGSNKDD